MRKFIKDDFIKIIILLGFTFFFGKIVLTGDVEKYVHPRIVPFIYLTIAGFIIMICVEIKKMCCVKSMTIQVKKYIILGLSLSFIFYMETSNIGDFNADVISPSYASTNSKDLNLDMSRGETKPKTSTENKIDVSDNSSIDNKKLNEVDGIITIERDNFVRSLDEILSNPIKYDGREISISGFIYRDNNVRENEFILGRYMMVCCAADLQIAGIVCKGESQGYNEIGNNTWVKINGTIINENNEPIIVVSKLEIDNNPDKQYVYPF